MKKFFSILTLAISALPIAIAHADAGGLGESPWRNVVGSMVATLLAIVTLVVVVMLIVRICRRRNEFGDTISFGGEQSFQDMRERHSRIDPSNPQTAPWVASQVDKDVSTSSSELPANFDLEGFIRTAKNYFIRLQAAWDRADLNDISQFTTSDMLDALKTQLQARGIEPNHTSVLALDAALLSIETSQDRYLAVVKFDGRIKDAEDALAAPFVEVWNLSKPVSGSGVWILAGIEQLE